MYIAANENYSMTISKMFQTVKFVLTVEYSISILNHGIYNQSYEFKYFWKNKTKLDFLHGDLFNKIILFEMKVNAFHVEKNSFIKKRLAYKKSDLEQINELIQLTYCLCFLNSPKSLQQLSATVWCNAKSTATFVYERSSYVKTFKFSSN